MEGGAQVYGLEPRQGETAFAFLVLRLARPMERAEFVELLHHVAPMLPDAEGFIAGFPEGIDEAMQIIGLPWVPPEPRDIDEHRALIASAAQRGVEAAWFFQIGTSLPSAGGDEDEDEDEDEDGNGAEEAAPAAAGSLTRLAATTDDSWDDPFAGDVTDPQTQRLYLEDVQRGDDEDDDDEDDDGGSDMSDGEGDDDDVSMARGGGGGVRGRLSRGSFAGSSGRRRSGGAGAEDEDEDGGHHAKRL